MSQEGLGPEEELPAGNVDFHREKHKPVFSLRIKFLSHDINNSPRNTHLVWWCWTISPALAAGLRQGNGGAGPSPQHSGRGRGKREVHTREGQILSSRLWPQFPKVPMPCVNQCCVHCGSSLRSNRWRRASRMSELRAPVGESPIKPGTGGHL